MVIPYGTDHTCPHGLPWDECGAPECWVPDEPPAWHDDGPSGPHGEKPAPPDDHGPLSEEDRYAILVDTEVRKLRAHRDARQRLDAEEHARTWRPPADVGSLKEWLTAPETQPQWRFEGLLGHGHNAIVVAGRKAGKTTFIDNVAGSYVDGGLFLGQFPVTTTGRAVAIFNYELEAEQYRRWLRETGISATDRVYVLNLRGLSLPLANDRVAEWVAGWLRDRDVGLWIVDPWSRAYVGSVDNGNDEAQVGRFLNRLDEIKLAAGVDELVMPVHTPKGRIDPGEESAIGSQRLEGWPDVICYVVRDGDQRFMRAEGRDVAVPESPLDYDTARRALTLQLGGGSRQQVRDQADRLALLEYLREAPGSTGSDIEGNFGWNARRRRQIVDAAIRDGLVTRRPGPKNAQLHWRAIDAPKEQAH